MAGDSIHSKSRAATTAESSSPMPPLWPLQKAPWTFPLTIALGLHAFIGGLVGATTSSDADYWLTWLTGWRALVPDYSPWSDLVYCTYGLVLMAIAITAKFRAWPILKNMVRATACAGATLLLPNIFPILLLIALGFSRGFLGGGDGPWWLWPVNIIMLATTACYLLLPYWLWDAGWLDGPARAPHKESQSG